MSSITIYNNTVFLSIYSKNLIYESDGFNRIFTGNNVFQFLLNFFHGNKNWTKPITNIRSD